MRICRIIIFACLAAWPALSPAHSSDRVALVIGNGAYTGPYLSPLPNPIRDAEDTAEALRELGFIVTLRLNLNADGMVTALEDFRRAAMRADITIIYYAGHGMSFGEESYLLATDARPTRASHLLRHGLSLSEVTETLEISPGLKIIILDSCRDQGLTPFLRQQEAVGRSASEARTRQISRGLRRPSATLDTLVAFATAAGEIASDGSGRNSPFTEALLQNLRSCEEIGFVFRMVRQAVMDNTGGEQRPELLNAVGARKYFLANCTPNLPPEPAPKAGPCMLVDTPAEFECYVENGRAQFRNVVVNSGILIDAPTSTGVSPAAQPPLTPAQIAQQAYACMTEGDEQGVSFARKCWPMRVSSISVPGRAISNIAPLAGLTALQMLDLRETEVSDLTPLVDLARLQRLYLSRTRASNLRPLSGLTGLRVLDLSGTQVNDLTILNSLTELRELNLWATQVGDLAPLESMTELRELNLWETQVNDLAILSGLTALQELNLSRTMINDLTPLSGLTRLLLLDLHETQVSDLTPLSGLTELLFLDLHETQVNDLSPLSGLTELLFLDLHETQVNDLSPLLGLPQLTFSAPDGQTFNVSRDAAAIRNWRPTP